MDFFLQIDANGSIRTDYLIGAHSSGCRNVAARVGNSNVRAIVANDVMSSLYGSGHEAFEDWSRGTDKSSLGRQYPQRMPENRHRQDQSESEHATNSDGRTRVVEFAAWHGRIPLWSLDVRTVRFVPINLS
jgi:hypothetical protein